jgi:hypothetical protein
VASNIDKAREQIARGQCKAAVSTLWLVEHDVRGNDGMGARELMDVAESLLAHTKRTARLGKVRRLHMLRVLRMVPPTTMISSPGFAAAQRRPAWPNGVLVDDRSAREPASIDDDRVPAHVIRKR